nr:ALKBH5 [Catalpa fargesii]
MPPVAGVVAGDDRIPVKPMMVQQLHPPLMKAAVSEAFAKDAILAWFRGEFAAANAIIDALCIHLTQLEGGDGGGLVEDYEPVLEAIHRRRLNWIPVLQMQRYYSIADVTLELKKVAEKRRGRGEVSEKKIDELVNHDCISAFDEKEKKFESCVEISEDFQGEVVDEDGGGEEMMDDSPHSEITDSGSQEVQPFPEHVDICSNHEECESRRAQIKMTKGFVAKEPVKGHMVNVVRGLKLHEDIFTDVELSKLNDFVNDLRIAGRNGELSGETFILYNQQMKGNKRELIQLGVPIFGQIKQDATDKSEKSNIEPFPALLQRVIEHLIQWRLVPENREPNSCIINFFDEGEYSQPFLKPPHLEQPLSTLLLSESKMAFGRTLVCDTEGNYRGPLTLSLNQGSLLVMRGNSSDTARHVMCSSPNKRVTISFFRVRSLHTDAESISNLSEITPLSKAMTLWQPGAPTPYTNGPMGIIPKWGLLQSPMVMLAPVHPVAGSSRRFPRGGTGVFLPWTVGLRKPAKHLPPRAQRQRLLALPSPV